MRLSLYRTGLVLISFGVFSLGRLPLAQSAPPQPMALDVDLGSSRVYVKVGAEGYGHSHVCSGTRELREGRIGADKGGELVFDMRSFAVDVAEARQALGLTRPVSPSDQKKITASMLGADVLDVARYPNAVFAIAAAVPLDGQPVGDVGRYQLRGEFTLHGVTRPLLFMATLEPTDRPSMVRMRGAFSILQSEYGMKPYSALAGLVRVADKLEVTGDLMLSVSGR